MPSITFLLTGDLTEEEGELFEASIPQRLRSLTTIVVSSSPGFSFDDEMTRATTLFVAVVTEPLIFLKRGFAKLLAALSEDMISDVFYCDSASIRRPDFSPERLRCQNYLGGLVVYRPALLRSIGGYRGKFGKAASFDLALRATAAASIVTHFPVALYRNLPSASRFLTDVTSTSLASAQDFTQILSEHLRATGGGHVVTIGENGVFDTRRDVVGSPLVSIVIPTRGTTSVSNGVRHCFVVDAVRSIVAMTAYGHYEIVVVADAVADPEVLNELSSIAGERLRLVTWDRPFNFSEKMNFGVLHARGEYVLLLNDDIDVLTRNWLESMLALAQRPNAGMVGAMLYYDDDTIQHAGHAYYQGSPTHIGLGQPRDTTGPNNGYLVEREVSGVTAACALMPKEVFLEVGGFTALLPGNFNDVDLCLKVGWKGYDIYWTPHAELYHFESKTRDAHVHFYELDVIEHRWGLRLDDPRYWPGHPAAAN